MAHSSLILITNLFMLIKWLANFQVDCSVSDDTFVRHDWPT